MKQDIIISISTTTIIKCLAWFMVLLGMLYVSDFIVALLIAVVLATAATLPISYMTKHRIPRGLAVVSIFLTLLALIVTTAFIFIPPLAEDLAHFVQTLPQILESIRISGVDLGFKDLAGAVQTLSSEVSKGEILTLIKNAVLGTGGFFATTSVLLGGVINIVLIFVMAFYLALEENGVLKFLRLLVPKIHEVYIEDLWTRTERKISLWMQGQILLSLLVALLVYVPMLILSIPYAALLAVLAFLGELIPLIGLTFSAIPALFLAWTHGGSSLFIIVAVIYFVIGQLESHVLYPRVMSRLVGVPSIIVIIALVMGAKLAGLYGVILSVPIAAFLMEVVTDINKRKYHVDA
jgi:predicted PurR-regulated permease PerM